MTVNSVGTDVSQIWQQLRDARQQQSSDRGAFAAAQAGASSAPASSDNIGSAVAKVVADLGSLVLGAQSASSSPGSTPTPTTAAATGPAPAAGSPPSSLASDLNTLLGDLGASGDKATGAGHHHHHHARPAGTDTGAPAQRQDGTAQQNDGTSLLASFAKALKAYGASTPSSTTAASALVSA